MKTQGIGPVFQVSNLNNALKYYKEILGFKEDFQFGAYAGLATGMPACICPPTDFIRDPLVEGRPLSSVMKSTIIFSK
jgi:hypothetical protein